MQIIKTKLNFKNLNLRAKTHRIIIHHSASSDVPADKIHDWHLARGFSGIGYHFVIRSNGNIEEGRPIDTIGAHALEANQDSIGICLTGNFEYSPPTSDQLQSLHHLLAKLQSNYSYKLAVLCHREVSSTVCPGAMFPGSDFSRAVKPQEELAPLWKENIISQARAKMLITQEHLPDDLAPKWFVLAVALNLLDKVKKD